MTLNKDAVSQPNRRTIVKGMAWTAPAVAIAGAAPAFAASPIPANGLNGWVSLITDCGSNDWLDITGIGDYPSRGLWTFVPSTSPMPTTATITFFFNYSNLTFTNRSERLPGPGQRPQAWTNLVRNASLDSQAPAPGFYAYTATYLGGWVYDATLQPTPEVDPEGELSPGGWKATRDPRWTTSSGNCRCYQAYSRRSVTFDGDPITFTRGPISNCD